MNDHDIYVGDWRSLDFLKSEAEYIAAKTGYSVEDIYEYLIAEREADDMMDLDLSFDIRDKIAEMTGMCLFKIVFIMDAEQAFYDEISSAYHCAHAA
jgi:hypothetical protein